MADFDLGTGLESIALIMREATISNLEALRARGRSAAGWAAAVPANRADRPGVDGHLTGQVADHVQTAIARVPSWFTVAQARRVAQLKGVGHVLTEDHGRVSGSVSVATLAGAPGTDAVARWTSRTDSSVAPGASVGEAERVMREARVGCLPVVAGGILVGTVSLVDLLRVGRGGDGGGDHEVHGAGISHAA